jgi:hypothetical protein
MTRSSFAILTLFGLSSYRSFALLYLPRSGRIATNTSLLILYIINDVDRVNLVSDWLRVIDNLVSDWLRE